MKLKDPFTAKIYSNENIHLKLRDEEFISFFLSVMFHLHGVQFASKWIALKSVDAFKVE